MTHKSSKFTDLMMALDSLEGKCHVVCLSILLAEQWSKAELRLSGRWAADCFSWNPQKPQSRESRLCRKGGSMLKALESKLKKEKGTPICSKLDYKLSCVNIDKVKSDFKCLVTGRPYTCSALLFLNTWNKVITQLYDMLDYSVTSHSFSHVSLPTEIPLVKTP